MSEIEDEAWPVAALRKFNRRARIRRRELRMEKKILEAEIKIMKHLKTVGRFSALLWLACLPWRAHAVLDNYKNFAHATVSAGYGSSDTSIVLSSGGGALMPAVPFNAVWFNSTDYPNAYNDPNVEVVRVTARTSETLTITRGQEGTSATPKNTTAKTYKLFATFTAKFATDIASEIASAGAGSGLTSLNSQTGATQNFASGTTGSDFAISSSGNVHTFNLPNASGANRGALTSADWTTFNAKLSSTSIDTSAELAAILTDETGAGALVFGTAATLTSPTLTTPTFSGALTLPDNVRQIFNPGVNAAGLNVGSIAGDPDTPSNGDVWYDSTANEFTARINGANVALGAGGGSGLTSLNSQTGATQTFASGTTGSDFAISSSGNVHTFNLPSASGANRGALTSADWTTFNAKLGSSALDTSAELAALVTDETGAGALVFGTSPTLTTPSFSGLANWPDDVTQFFNPGANNPGLNVGSHASDPAGFTNGSLWYNSTAAQLKGAMGGVATALAGLALDQTFTGRAKFQNTVEILHALGNATGTVTVSWATNSYSLTATGNIVFALSGSAPTSGDQASRTLWFTQDATGSRTLTIASASISVNPAANSVTIVSISTKDGGTTLVVESNYSTGGSGDVTAAANFANDNRLIRSDGTSKGVQASAITVDDSGNVSGVGTLAAGATTVTSLTASTGADTVKTLEGNYALLQTSSAGAASWLSVNRPLSDFRRGMFLPAATSFGSGWYQGEPFSANGTATATEATSTLPSMGQFIGTATLNAEVGLDAGAFGFWFTGKNIMWSGAVEQTSTNVVRCFYGLTATSRDNMAGSDAPNFKYAGFQYSDSRGDTTWQFITSNGAGATTLVNTGVAVTPGTLVHLKFMEDVANSRWIALINGATVATNSSNIPTSTKLQTVAITSQLEAVSKTNRIAYLDIRSAW